MIIPRIIGIPGLLLLLGLANVQAQYSTLHTFIGGTNDGSTSKGSVLVYGSALYGMTGQGGTTNKGVIFKMNTDGSGYTNMHSFTSGVNDGASPQYNSLTPSGTNLYGMTAGGGSAGYGVIFRINTDGSGYTNLHGFVSGASDGNTPYGSLTLSGTNLYGMTELGGSGSGGALFRINTDGSGYTNLHMFAGGASEGKWPYGSVTVSGTNLYGMSNGGGLNYGVIFRLNADGTGYTNLHVFATGGDGQYPYGSLIVSGTNFYGMTDMGGSANYGTVFKINADGSGYTTLHSFAGSTVDGQWPYGDLTLSGTTLNGMTSKGPGANLGTIFKLNIDGSGYTNLHTFAGRPSDGATPYGTLASSGASVYGLTSVGGTSNFGVVFSLTLANVTTAVSPTNSGSVAVSWFGANLQLLATGSNGWQFASWNDGTTNNPYTIAVPASNITYTATFAQAATITVGVSTNAGGSVTGTGVYILGNSDVLTATASNGWMFVGWSDGVTDNPRTVVVASNQTYTANFAPTVLIVAQANPPAGGSVVGGGTYPVGGLAMLTVTTSNLWRFTGWTDGDTNNPRTVVAPIGGGTYTASFSPLGTVSTLANPTNGGSVTGDGLYLVGSTCTVTAAASNQWLFLNWNGSVTNNPWSFSVTSGTTVCTANYAAASTVTVLASPVNGGSVAGGGVCYVGSNATLSATASNNWMFFAWNDGNTNVLHTITVPPSNITYTATFAPAATLTVGANTNAGGSVTGSGQFFVGSNEVLTATASNNWQFLRWSDGVTNNPRTVVVASNQTFTALFAPTALLSVQANPPAGGSVAGGGTYVVGSNAVLTATASNNWQFLGWTDSATNNPRTVVVSAGGGAYTANFGLLGRVSTLANPTNGGSQLGDGQYLVGSNATVTAAASNHWTFLNWNGGLTNNPWVFSVTSGTTVCTANYASASMVTVLASPTNSGTVAGGGGFIVGSNAILTAASSGSWLFLAWDDGNTNAQRTITVPAQDSSYTAFFAPAATLTVAANTNAGGSVTGSGVYILGSNEVLTATASNNWQFLGWSDGVTNNPRTVVVSSNQSFTALFAPTALLIALANPPAGGSVTGSGTYVVGSNVVLTVAEATNWRFTGWADSGTNNPRTVVMPPSGATYTANFSPLGTVSTVANPTNGGSQTGAGQYLVGATCTVTAASSNHWLFLNWNGSLTNNPWVFSVTSGTTVCTANYAAASTVTVVANPTNGGSVAGGGAFYVGSNATLSATATNGWMFFDWNDGNTNTPRSITVPPADSTYTATFAPAATLTVGANTNAGGSVTGGGFFFVGSNEVLTATASNNWQFLGWSDGVTNNPRTVMVASNQAFTALFAPTALLVAQANPPAGGSVIGGGTYVVGSNAVLTVTEATNWRFINWNDGDTNSPRTVAVPANGASFVANFSPLGTVSTLANPTNGGSQTGAGQYLVGATCAVTAASSNHWLFLNWNGSLTNNPWVFSVTSGTTVCTANYAAASTVAVVANPTNGGNVAGGGAFCVGSNATLSATAANGWMFFDWNDGDTNGQRTITVPPADSTYTATFAPAATLTVGANTNAGGSVTGGGFFFVGSNEVLTATASNNWQFLGWSDGVTNNPRMVVVASNQAFTALFAPTAGLTVQASPAAGGSVTGGGTYLVGSNAVLTVTAANNWRFIHWDDGATNNPRTVTISGGSASYTAYLQPLGTVSTLANPINGGSVTGDGLYLVDSNATVTAVASNRWLFLDWNGSVTNNPWVFSVTSGTTVCTANFALVSTVTAVANPSYGGSVTGGGLCFVGSNATLTAVAAGSWKFTTWNDGNTNVQRSFTVPAADCTYTATFETAATITVDVNTNAGGYVTGGGVYFVGRSDVLVATASNNWRFIGWDDGVLNRARTITVASNQSFVAIFAPTAQLAVQANPPAGGSVTGAGAYVVGSNAVLTAAASNNWLFSSWNDGVTNPTRTVPVPAGGASYIANFQALGTVVAQVGTNNGGSVTGGGAYLAGAPATVTATASNNWLFLCWNNGITNNPWTFSVAPGTNLCTAKFAQLSVVTVLSGNTNLGTVTGGGTNIVGSTCLLTAVTQPGWALSSWTDGNTQNPRAFIVPPTNVTLTASFAVSTLSLVLGNALNAPGLFWQTGGDGTWAPTTTASRDGQAAQSGPLSGGQQTWLQVVTNGPGSLVFWWKISSELSDTLQFSVNGAQQSQLIASTGWQQYAVYLGTTNTYTLRWTFAKNTYSTAGGNAGYLDQVTWTPCPYAVHVPQVYYQDAGGMLASWVLNTNAAFRFARILANTGGWVLKAAGDLDGDGVSDLLFQTADGEICGWLMNPDGSVRDSLYRYNVAGWEIKACGDYEGLHRGQLFFQTARGDVAYWRFDIHGNFQSSVSLGNMGGWLLRGIGDLDGDGKAELFWQNASGSVAIWYHNADGSIRGVVPCNAGGWVLSGVVDLDGDGISDLLWQDGSGNTGGWLMNSNGTARTANYWWNTGGWKLKAAGR